MSADKTFDLASIRARLSAVRGRQFRRRFLKLMGASLALAGASACTRQPDELIVPYVRQPENVVPGRPLFFATAMPLSGSAIGLLAESHQGRPTKIEGNPDHPASLGATDAYAQASVLQLYDPDRSTAITFLGEIRPWGTFVQVISQALSQRQAVQGAGLRFLTESVASPTLASQLQEVLTSFPQARWSRPPIGSSAPASSCPLAPISSAPAPAASGTHATSPTGAACARHRP